MKPKLRPDDRRAVDLLLDRVSSAIKGNGHALYAGNNVATRQRIQHVEHLLHLLDTLEQPEPPQDLIARTLAHTLGCVDECARLENHPLHAMVHDASRPLA